MDEDLRRLEDRTIFLEKRADMLDRMFEETERKMLRYLTALENILVAESLEEAIALAGGALEE